MTSSQWGMDGLAVGYACAPGAPTLSGTAGAGQNTLTWAAVTGATSYTLYDGTTNIYTGSLLTYTESGLTNGTYYNYTLTVTTSGGTSPASNVVSLEPVDSSGGAYTFNGVNTSPFTESQDEEFGLIVALAIATWFLRFFIYKGKW
jgi:hypothetical protein